jgi:hypothetical protein
MLSNDDASDFIREMVSGRTQQFVSVLQLPNIHIVHFKSISSCCFILSLVILEKERTPQIPGSDHWAFPNGYMLSNSNVTGLKQNSYSLLLFLS